ncbi:MAG: peptidylprolyl isomerase [Ruminococcaceae bacterium]|nr:peptidylprolyl isomerase [Oscillospiraceae bacterium]
MNTKKIIITMQTGDVMEAELYPEIAPKTVANFVQLIEDGFFEGLIFHRVIKGFMIQGGGYDKDGNHKDAATIKGEFASNGFENPLKHERGVLSMARTMVRDSASSQFFIMHQAAPHLDGEYAAFGKVTAGLEVIDKIANVPTDFSDCPIEPQVIASINMAE